MYLKLLLRLVMTAINWPIYFVNRLGLIKGNVRYYLWNGLIVESGPYAVHGSALNEVWLDRSYDPNAFGVRFDWKNAKNIVDIGSHIGTFTLFAAAKAPSANIFAFEPEPKNFAMLTKNLELNALQGRVTPFNVGVGNGQRMTLYTFPNDNGGNSIYRTNEGGIPVEIETVSLKDIFDRHDIALCDYLKIDCEGAEYEALYALPKEYFSRIRMIGMEYHHFSANPRHTSDTLQKHLEENGFTIKRHKKSMMLAYRGVCA